MEPENVMKKDVDMYVWLGQLAGQQKIDRTL